MAPHIDLPDHDSQSISIGLKCTQVTDLSWPNDRSNHNPRSTDGIAIIGMGCRLPGSATNPEAFWEMLMNKESANTTVPTNRWDVDKFLHSSRQAPGSMTTAGGYFLRDDPTLFEPQLFSMNPIEAAGLDPALKKLLEVVYETTESAGITLDQLAGSETGCYVGSFNHDELFAKVRDSYFAEPYTGTSAIAPFLANRISYIFDIHGPSMTVDTACSASFHALHLARQAIERGEIESAIVASSNLVWSPDMQIFLDKLGALSSTSQCHVFGSDADGYGRADGFVSLFVKDLQAAIRDGDAIQAVITGTAVNSNGRTGGITHPSPVSQEAAMRQAYRSAGNLNPKDTAYYECHGTGTAVGDPLELKGIQNYFFPFRSPDNPLLLGSVKSNVGHAEPVSGLTGLLKAVLAIKNGILPPMISPTTISPKLDLDDTKFKLLSEPHRWPEHNPRRASVATSGFGGANAHVIVEEYKAPEGSLANGASKASESQISQESKFLLPFSAHKPESLLANFQAISAVRSRYSAIDLAYTLGVRRSKLLYRGFAIISEQNGENLVENNELQTAKRLRTTHPKVGFVFTGQGAQWPQMGKELFQRFTTFRSTIHRMTSTLKRLSDGPSWTLEDIILAPKNQSQIYSAEVSQPACTAIQIALVAVLTSFNIIPVACMGHSSGEMAAAYAAGRISEEEAILAAYYRGKWVSKLSRDGSMVAIGIGVEAAEIFLAPLRPRVDIAAINSPESITVSGDTDAIQELSAALSKRDIFNRVLATGGKAYHSSHMKEIGKGFESSLQQATFTKKGMSSEKNQYKAFFSSVTGQWFTDESQITSSYWRQNLESPVMFSPALSKMVEYGVDHIVEVGPHSALAGPIRQIEACFRMQSKAFALYSPTLVRNKDGEECMLALVGTLFNDGVNVEMQEVNRISNPITQEDEKPKLLTDLPTYKYSYGPSNHRMSRMEREFRYPKFPFHQLLGGKVLGCSPRSPSWRNILSTKTVPDIDGLKFLGTCSMPVSCLLEMGFVAAQQLASTCCAESLVPRNITMTNINLPNILTLETERDVVTTFYMDESEEPSFLFEITSVQGDEGILHCSGQVKIEKVDMDDRKEINGTSVVPSSKWYSTLEATGLEYKASWQTMGPVHIDPFRHVYRCDSKFHDILSQQVSRIETCIQLAILSTAPYGQPQEFSLVYPSSIAKVQLVPWSSEPSSDSCFATASAHGQFADVKLQSLNHSPAIVFEGIFMETVQQAKNPLGNVGIALESIWKPDFTTIKQSDVDRLFPAPPFPEVDDFNKVHRMASAMVIQYISEGGHPKKESLTETGYNFLEWLETTYKSAADAQIPSGTELMQMKPSSRIKLIEDLYDQIADRSVEAQLMMRMYKNLNGILDGSISAHDVIISDGLLAKLYTSTPTAVGSMIQLRKIVDLVGHKYPAAKYLEIGGGTRGATREILDVLGARAGPRRYSEYCFTDVSSYFLSGARDEFHDCGNISYATLNIEQLPSDQGFVDGYYDVVVAANVLHATTSIEETLRHVRMLLKPGGKLILVETTIETVWLTIVLGGFSDYWKGRRDARPTSPFIPVSQWNQLLQRTGFTGTELNLPDYEDPFRSMNVLISTATEGPEAIERFYPTASASQNRENRSMCLGSDPSKKPPLTNGTHQDKSNGIQNGASEAWPDSNTIVLVDWMDDVFFPDITNWLTAMGIQHLVLASSDSVCTTDRELAMPHIEELRKLGVNIHIMETTLSFAIEEAFATELRTIATNVKGLIFAKHIKTSLKHPEPTASILTRHRTAQRIFTGSLLPEKVLIFTPSEAIFADPNHPDVIAHSAILDMAQSWVDMGASTNVFGMGNETHTDSMMNSFDYVAPTATRVFASNGPTQSHPSFISHMRDMALLTEKDSATLLENDERFSVILQEAQAKVNSQPTDGNDDKSTPLAAAVVKFQSISSDRKDARRSAAVDAVVELLAELLFIPKEQVNVQDKLIKTGIDSLVASELRKQLTQYFGVDISTGWLLGGDVTSLDIVEALCTSQFG